MYGYNPVVLRSTAVSPASATLYLQEETSADPETDHLAEEVSLIVFE